MFDNFLIAIKGGGDIATGVAWRLYQSGFPVFITERESPLVVRRAVAFAQAVFYGETIIEGVKAVRVDSIENIFPTVNEGNIPVIVDPEAVSIKTLKPDAVIDAIMNKNNTGTKKSDAKMVIGLGPGFKAGKDVHMVVETKRGHDLGRLIRKGNARKDTGVPSKVLGYTHDRLLLAPCSGFVKRVKEIGEYIYPEEVICMVNDAPVVSKIEGVLRGIVHDGVFLEHNDKLGDVDPRGIRSYCFTISDKSLAVAGGVIEGILSCLNIKRSHMLNKECKR